MLLLGTLVCAAPSALAQDKAGPQPEKKVEAQKALDLRSNPLAYYIPEAWRERARVFIDPGQRGLDGGYVLKDIALGHDIKATFAAGDELLIVRIVPSRVALEGDRWRGERVAIRVVQASPASEEALAHLERLLEARESGWGWLRRDPSAEDRRAAAKAALKDIANAERMLTIGLVEQGVALIQHALQKAPNDTLAHLRAARALYLAGRPSLATLKAQVALPTALKALEAKGLDIALQARTKVYVARAKALAEDTTGALALSREVLMGPMACALSGLVRDLVSINALDKARALAKDIAKRDPSCDAAQALRVDLLAQARSSQDAAVLAEGIVKARTGLSLARSAWACAALAAGDLKTATLQASVPVERGGPADPALLILSSILRQGGLELAPLAKWDNMLSRDASAANRALAAARLFAEGDYANAENQLVALKVDTGPAPGLDAMRALGLIRLGRLPEAKAAAEGGWPAVENRLWIIAAEAEIAEAEGKRLGALAAWQAYLAGFEPGRGPLTRKEAQAKVAYLSGEHGGKAKVSTRQLKPQGDQETQTTSSDAEGESDLGLSLLGLCIAFAALWWWRRSR